MPCRPECCHLPIWSKQPWSDFTLRRSWVGAITVQDIPDIKAVWRPLIRALCDVVPVRWIGSQHSRRDGFIGEIETRSPVQHCSIPPISVPIREVKGGGGVREALRWARALVTGGKATPDEIAIFGRLCWRRGTMRFWFSRREAGLPCTSHTVFRRWRPAKGRPVLPSPDILLRMDCRKSA